MPAAISVCQAGGVKAAAEHQGRTIDAHQVRPAVRPGHDRRLLAQEGVSAHAPGHRNHFVGERPVRDVRRVQQERQQPRGHALEITLAGQRDQIAPST